MMVTPGGNSLPAYTGRKTSGILVKHDGVEILLSSGISGPSQGTLGIPGMHNRIKSHVEAHAAVVIRRERLIEATLYINRVPCPTVDPRSPGCLENLPKMLPEAAKLRIIGPGGFDETFNGLADPPGTLIIGI